MGGEEVQGDLKFNFTGGIKLFESAGHQRSVHANDFGEVSSSELLLSLFFIFTHLTTIIE
jgi:hypothetical protein